MSVFKAYDIRGVYGQDLNEELAYKVGFYLPQLLQSDHVLIGRDARLSSPSLFESMAKGVNDAGCDVWDIGQCTTPTVYYAGPSLHAKACVMITASHNPPRYNGFKISRELAKPVGKETGLMDLEKLCQGTPVPVQKKGRRLRFHIRQGYLNFVRKWLKPLDGLKVVFDSSNGVEGLYLQELFQNSGAETSFINLEVDGTFPNHEPNPLEVENCHQLMEKVKECKADVGVIFDGDADRCIFVDEKGQFVFPDIAMGVMARELLQKRPGVVGYDVRSSRSVTEEISRLGGDPKICRVGHSYAKKLLREHDGTFGGELAGHYYFRDNNYCDSALIAALVVLGILAENKRSGGQSLSQMISEITKYHYSGEINFKAENKDELIDVVYKHFQSQGGQVNDLDGIRVDFKDWWYNLRKSNTEPYLRLVTEASTKAMLDQNVATIRELIEKHKR